MLIITFIFLLAIICLIRSFIANGYDGGIWMGGFIWISLFGLIISIMIIGTGISRYPELKAKYEKNLSLKSEIQNIERAYHETINDGTLIGGSLDNQGQAQKWTEYIRLYAEEKAEYNGYLDYSKTVKQIRIYQLFTYSLFISDKIYELEKL